MAAGLPSFVQAQGSPDIYQVLGNGVLDKVQNAADFAARGGTSNDQIQQVSDLGAVYMPDIQAQADAQVDPGLAATTDTLNQNQATDLTANQQVLDALQKSFALKQQQDPYARNGSVSGQANAYNLDQQNTAVSQQGQSLAAQLAAIAQQLNTATTSASTQKAGIISQLQDQYTKNNTDYQTAEQAAATAAAKVTPVDLGGSIALMTPDGQIVGQIGKSASPGSASANPGIDLSSLFSNLGGTTGGTSSTPNQSITSATQDLQQLFSLGMNNSKVAGQDAPNIAALASATGLTPQKAASLYYSVRKPFEGPTVSVLQQPKNPAALLNIGSVKNGQLQGSLSSAVRGVAQAQ